MLVDLIIKLSYIRSIAKLLRAAAMIESTSQSSFESKDDFLSSLVEQVMPGIVEADLALIKTEIEIGVITDFNELKENKVFRECVYRFLKLPLLRIAKNIFKTDVADFEDYLQEAYVELFKRNGALDSYDVNKTEDSGKPIPLEKLVSFIVKRELRTYRDSNTGVFYLGLSARRYREVNKASHLLFCMLGRYPNINELSEHLTNKIPRVKWRKFLEKDYTNLEMIMSGRYLNASELAAIGIITDEAKVPQILQNDLRVSFKDILNLSKEVLERLKLEKSNQAKNKLVLLERNYRIYLEYLEGLYESNSSVVGGVKIAKKHNLNQSSFSRIISYWNKLLKIELLS